MGGAGAADAGEIQAWATGEVVAADDHQRAFVYFAQRSTLANATGRLPADDHGSALLLRLARRRAMDHDQSLTDHGLPDGYRPPGLSQRWRH